MPKLRLFTLLAFVALTAQIVCSMPGSNRRPGGRLHTSATVRSAALDASRGCGATLSYMLSPGDLL